MNFNQEIAKIVTKALKKLEIDKAVQVEKSNADGDFSSNIALTLAKDLKQNPLAIATKIVDQIKDEMFAKIEVAKPGFINFYLSEKYLHTIVDQIAKEKDNYGKNNDHRYLNVEFVSANPTGHLHVGHARGAVYGDVLIKTLRFAGNKVDSEYYINDAGNQINILGEAVFVRYLQKLGKKIAMPEDTYRGQEIIDVAEELIAKFGPKYQEESYEKVATIFQKDAKQLMLKDIKDHLHALGVDIAIYSSETAMIESGFVHKTIKKLGDKVYQKDGATWLKTSEKGDDKDRVLIKANGEFTYFGPDVGYHNFKLSRGYDKILDVWGADHVGQVQKIKIALEFLGYPQGSLEIPLIQMVKLLRNGKELKMSKRAGTAYRLIDLVDEIGKDAARWFMISRANESQFTLDLDLVKKDSRDNPLFFVQYAHARANQLINKAIAKKADEKGVYSASEKQLILHLYEFPTLIKAIAINYKVHLLPAYLLELARYFNSWYSNQKVLGTANEANLIALTKAVKQVLKNGLTILGIEAPIKM